MTSSFDSLIVRALSSSPGVRSGLPRCLSRFWSPGNDLYLLVRETGRESIIGNGFLSEKRRNDEQNRRVKGGV
jgi:hypothetical protein